MTDEGKIYSMEIICAYKNINPGILIFDKEYQRTIEPMRIRRISESMKKYGYWPQEVIIITHDLRVIDGQHRAKAAIHNNITKVPVSIVKFPTREKEAEFFAAKNNWNTSLKPIDFWFARYLSGEKISETIYRLESDPNSLLYKSVALKGRETEKSKFLITNVLAMLSGLTGAGPYWERVYDNSIREKIIRLGYEGILKITNDYLKWFYAIWGNNKKENGVPYRQESIRAIIQFYKILQRENISQKISIPKMKSFLFTVDFIKATQAGKTFALASHFNHGRQKKIPYE